MQTSGLPLLSQCYAIYSKIYQDEYLAYLITSSNSRLREKTLEPVLTALANLHFTLIRGTLTLSQIQAKKTSQYYLFQKQFEEALAQQQPHTLELNLEKYGLFILENRHENDLLTTHGCIERFAPVMQRLPANTVEAYFEHICFANKHISYRVISDFNDSFLSNNIKYNVKK